MLKEQARTEIERIFDNPEAWHVVKNTYGDITIDEPILKVEWVADQIIACFQDDYLDKPLTDAEHEIVKQEWEKAHAIELALKEQMERVMGAIDKELEFHKEWLRLRTEYPELHMPSPWATITALNNIKAELEGENE